MIRALRHFRDFVDDETKKWMVSNLKVESCMLLVQHKGGREGEPPFHTVIQVFDHAGIWIGEISDPDYVPFKTT